MCPLSAIRDLKQRGLLDETLVIWGGEFGHSMSEKGDGRDHNPTGFTMWMAGGGARGGQMIGATDELGLYAVEDKLHVHDIHSTIMAMLGLITPKSSTCTRAARNASTSMRATSTNRSSIVIILISLPAPLRTRGRPSSCISMK